MWREREDSGKTWAEKEMKDVIPGNTSMEKGKEIAK